MYAEVIQSLVKNVWVGGKQSEVGVNRHTEMAHVIVLICSYTSRHSQNILGMSCDIRLAMLFSRPAVRRRLFATAHGVCLTSYFSDLPFLGPYISIFLRLTSHFSDLNMPTVPTTHMYNSILYCVPTNLAQKQQCSGPVCKNGCDLGQKCRQTSTLTLQNLTTNGNTKSNISGNTNWNGPASEFWMLGFSPAENRVQRLFWSEQWAVRPMDPE